MVVILRVQESLSPYRDVDNNRIEMLAIVSGIMTLYWALIFVAEEDSIPILYNISLILMFLINIYFIVNWIYLILSSLNINNSHFNTFMKYYGYILCRKSKSLQHIKIPLNNIKSKRRKYKKIIKSRSLRLIIYRWGCEEEDKV